MLGITVPVHIIVDDHTVLRRPSVCGFCCCCCVSHVNLSLFSVDGVPSCSSHMPYRKFVVVAMADVAPGCVCQVTVSTSQAGKLATARAVVRETGHLVGIRLLQPTCDYRCRRSTVVVSNASYAIGALVVLHCVLHYCWSAVYLNGVQNARCSSGARGTAQPNSVACLRVSREVSGAV